MEKPKTQGKNSTSRIFDTRPRSKLMLKKMPALVCTIQHGVYGTTGTYKHLAVLIWQVRECSMYSEIYV